MSRTRPRPKISSQTVERHLQVKMFDMPEVYTNEAPEFETEDRLMLCKLFIDSFKVLSYLEFTLFQALLVLQDSWNIMPEDPTELLGGEYSTHDPNYLTLEVVKRCLDTDYEKFVVVIRSCLKKLPILAALIDPFLLKEIRELPTDVEYESVKFSEKWLKFVGYILKNRTRREGKILKDRKLDTTFSEFADDGWGM